MISLFYNCTVFKNDDGSRVISGEGYGVHHLILAVVDLDLGAFGAPGHALRREALWSKVPLREGHAHRHLGLLGLAAPGGLRLGVAGPEEEGQGSSYQQRQPVSHRPPPLGIAQGG